MTDHTGKQLGNYCLLQHIGKGGFADVYLGKHIYLDSMAAIKVLHADLLENEAEKFRVEAKTLVGLNHQNIVRVLDFGIDRAIPFLVMEYVPNGTLRKQHARGTQVPLPTIVSYVKQIAAALQYAHNQKLIHRDVKPENILLRTHDKVVLSDLDLRSSARAPAMERRKMLLVLLLTRHQSKSRASPVQPVISIPWQL